MPAANVSEEISHLVRDKAYPHNRALAASLDMKRHRKFRKKGKRKRARR